MLTTSNHRLLGVDLGTKGGFATADWHTSWNDESLAKRPTSRDKRIKRFWDRLEALKDDIDMVAYEEARVAKHISALIVIAEYQGVLKTWCQLNGKPYVGYTPSEIKKFATGHGRADKDQMVEAAQKFRGTEVKNFDAADAICIYHLAMSDLCFLSETRMLGKSKRKPKQLKNVGG